MHELIYAVPNTDTSGKDDRHRQSKGRRDRDRDRDSDGGGDDEFKEGMKVEARFKGRSRWFPATIKFIRRDGTMDLLYDDGGEIYIVLLRVGCCVLHIMPVHHLPGVLRQNSSYFIVANENLTIPTLLICLFINLSSHCDGVVFFFLLNMFCLPAELLCKKCFLSTYTVIGQL